ncbi:hypothetical protein Glove_680g14 [Diversispora epigaea]|uniref:Uncharacterized protein n=1 Tax=Diversispora epigaea TaxID=1348612 RepID=A0A397G710_9GLOM|nr:hypothetical protein Glove_680g14 [Diversispora epigaea]
MKFTTFIIPIIVVLVTMTLVPYVEADHTVRVVNKMAATSMVTLTSYLDIHGAPYNSQWCISHCHLHLHFPDNVKTFYLVYEAGEEKTRGPFTNNRDYCFHIHGTRYKYEILDC